MHFFPENQEVQNREVQTRDLIFWPSYEDKFRIIFLPTISICTEQKLFRMTFEIRKIETKRNIPLLSYFNVLALFGVGDDRSWEQGYAPD